MLVLNPRDVTFGSTVWKDVHIISINRAATRQAVEWNDAGPHVVFADVPQQQVSVRVERRVQTEIDDSPKPGDSGNLTFAVAQGGDARRRRVSMTCVVVNSRNELDLARGAERIMDFVAVSPDGIADPVTIENIGVAP